jgi:hypothetical protein
MQGEDEYLRVSVRVCYEVGTRWIYWYISTNTDTLRMQGLDEYSRVIVRVCYEIESGGRSEWRQGRAESASSRCAKGTARSIPGKSTEAAKRGRRGRGLVRCCVARAGRSCPAKDRRRADYKGVEEAATRRRDRRSKWVGREAKAGSRLAATKQTGAAEGESCGRWGRGCAGGGKLWRGRGRAKQGLRRRRRRRVLVVE